MLASAAMTGKPHHTYFIRTFGCQMNEHDSRTIARLLERCGYRAAASLDNADIVLFNTCTIREKAKHKAESEMGRARQMKSRRGTIIGVCGCVAQQEGLALKEKFQGIDFVCGPDQLARIPDFIDRARRGSFSASTDFIDDPCSADFPHGIVPGTISGGSAFVAIMKGCNCACSYCIVPHVRGSEVSRPATSIIDEVRDLAARGSHEVTLLGQNVNAYGRARQHQKEGPSTFVELIESIAAVPGIERIRFTSPHPRDVGDDLIALYAREQKLCPHIHLPLQAGSNRILARMRRGYTRERFMEIAQALRLTRPGLSVTTDIIVGFCGEDDRDFADTIDLMERIRFDSIFAFCYSPRTGTEAAERFVDDVSHDVKKKRLAHVLALQKDIQLTLNAQQIGTTTRVLVVKPDASVAGQLTGRAGDNRLVHFAGHERQIGSIVTVRITGASVHSLQGEIEHDQ